MDGSVADLSKYRLEKAKEDLKTAKDNYCDCGKLCENQMVNPLSCFVLLCCLEK